MAENKGEVTIRCPGCGAKDVRRSFQQGLLDVLMSAFQRYPFRCRSCARRFYYRLKATDRVGQ